MDLIQTCAALRRATTTDVTAVTKTTLRALARRVHHLDEETADLQSLIRPLVSTTAPELLAHHGVGPDTAAALLIAAGTTPADSAAKRPSPDSAALHPSQPPAARPRTVTACTAAATDKRTPPSGASP